jgi:fumarate reductase flavoprotein subunit
MIVRPARDVRFPLDVPVLVIGAGACGMTASLAASERGADVLVLERDPAPAGSTALSSGMVPAAGTRLQQARGITDNPALFAADIQSKAGQRADPELVKTVCEASGPALEWLMDACEVPFELVEGFLYPGHSVARMHATPERTGVQLIDALASAAAQRPRIDLVTEATVTALFAEPDGRVTGVEITRPNGQQETAGCSAAVLACNGYGGNPEMVARYIPEMADAWYFGHPGNRGDAVVWGEALGGECVHMGAYQGHGSVATPCGVLVTWALMMNGGIQVNAAGKRFSNEHQGYSEQSVAVLTQPGGVAWNIYDARLHELGLEFPDYRNAQALGAIIRADSVASLADELGLPAAALTNSIAETDGTGRDEFGRDMGASPALAAPFYAVKVTGALFHTQGGLRIDSRARVLRRGSSEPLPNVYAGGGAAVGVSGPDVSGYLSGNGLLTAITLGRIAGYSAAARGGATLAPPHPDPLPGGERGLRKGLSEGRAQLFSNPTGTFLCRRIPWCGRSTADARAP